MSLDAVADDPNRLSRRSLLRLGGVAATAAVGGAFSRAALGQAPGLAQPAIAPTAARRMSPQRPGPTTIPPAPPLPPGSFQQGSLYVALYGHPGSRVLGALGEQSADGAVRRARAVADQYRFTGMPVVPTFEIIASVAAAHAGSDGDYSNEFGEWRFLPLLDAADRNGFHVLCDLQTGRSRFPDQARQYEFLWRRPNVSIALDPEWRFDAPGRPGGGRIGTVSAAEVNETVDYIDAVIRRHELPPKMLVVHQFTPSMISDKRSIRGTDRVQIVIHMDGFGSLTLKRGSYQRTVADLPAGAITGWKNFYDEDRPTPTPQQTMDNTPAPHLVTFQ